MKQLTIEAFKAMLDNALKQIKAREEEFSIFLMSQLWDSIL